MFTPTQGIALKNLSHKACGAGRPSRSAGSAGRSITKAVIQIGSRLPRSPKTAALGVLLPARVNTSLVGILSRARLSFPACRSLGGSPIVVEWIPSQVVLAILPCGLRQVHPRPPPIQVSFPSWNVVCSAHQLL